MAEIQTMRLDKWLWAARFFKTRALAQKNIELNRVLVNGEKIKNSKTVTVGDQIDITINSLPFRMVIKGLNMQRRPASEAVLLYQEDDKIKQKREYQKEINKSEQVSRAYPEGRPTKRDRRSLDKVKKQSWE